MQTVSDIFLGWTRSPIAGHDYYCRQLKDWKYSADVEDATAEYLSVSADMRGWTLARAHARAGGASWRQRGRFVNGVDVDCVAWVG
jgi:hypothetical protein